MTEHDSHILQLKGKKVLLADDMKLNQFVMGEMLRTCGLEVVFANNGEEALRLSGRQQFDIILLDVFMPVMDGIEACRQIRGLAHPNAKIPIVAVTANAFDSDLKEYHQAGVTATLVKPVDQQQLGEFLHSLLTPGGDMNGFKWKNDKGVTSEMRINLSYLEMLSKGNKEFVKTMMASFCETVTSLVEQLADAGIKKDISAISKLLHQLKFPLGVVGLTNLNGQIAVLEEKAKHLQHNDEKKILLQQVDALRVIVKDLLTQADDLLKENSFDSTS